MSRNKFINLKTLWLKLNLVTKLSKKYGKEKTDVVLIAETLELIVTIIFFECSLIDEKIEIMQIDEC